MEQIYKPAGRRIRELRKHWKENFEAGTGTVMCDP
jgi:hypothetical protein